MNENQSKICFCGNTTGCSRDVCDACRYEGNYGGVDNSGKQRGWRTNKLITEQVPPTPSTGDVWLLVLKDMEERRQMGIQKYGQPVQPYNGRDPLVDAYQEALDLCVYLRQAIVERSATSAALEADFKHWDELAKKPDSDQSTRAHRNGLKIALSYIKR